MASSLSIRTQMAAASKRIGRIRRIDRLAVTVITLGGIAIVLAVLAILAFVGSEALPLFRSARMSPASDIRLQDAPPVGAALRAIGLDEYQRYLYAVDPAGAIAFISLPSGARAKSLPLPGLAGATVTSSSVSLIGHYVAAGRSDGRASLVRVQYVPQYEGETLKDLAIELRDRGTAQLDAGGRAVRQISYLEQDGRKFVAGLVADDEIAYWRTDADDSEHLDTLRVDPPNRITHVRLGRGGALLAGTDHGRVYEWDPGETPTWSTVSEVSAGSITALEWIIGGSSWVAAAEDRSVSGWFRAPVAAGGESMVRAHVFEPQQAPVVAIAPSGRDRSFVTIGRDGEILLRHQTSERVLARLPAVGAVDGAVITPKADALVARSGSSARIYGLDSPHPETSWKALFGKVWYEGYAGPEYVWQSTGATDDFEPKFSLIPLIFGTLKGTAYAMLFAIPLAVLAALYTSQFTHPSIRGTIKPTVELMAALPSVVIGFLAGLYLAGLVERNLVAVFVMVPLLPLSGMAGMLIWRILPIRLTGALRAGSELVLILPLLAFAAWAATLLGPLAERTIFGGDARLWLQSTWGLTYDQRNCLVVGIAMGFAIVPIIFTISEDAFSSVPSSLTAASLALGATRWQTAMRVILPTASPGVFSAIMIGLGRAVGETMIVLMATGNTPVLDWSIFNGIRTLSANIAVEIPEAPYGATLYRTLFLAAALLFLMTFVVNTIAEIVRQRLRQRFQAV